ncbi:MAG TPA: hypothetical protein VJU18_04300 [Vicinamibacteria bacterium]|nr:hypothetical protein [Vicinamibacteria bacterium]
MRETPGEWEARTGLSYAPVPGLRFRGRVLARDEACPTLFRFPGAEALLAFLESRLAFLGVPGSPVLWLSARPIRDDLPSVERFGSVVLLEPLRANPVLGPEPGVYLGDNLALDRLGPLVWAPPSALSSDLDWDSVRTEAEARALLGGGWDGERAEAEWRLRAHLEERSAGSKRKRGAPVGTPRTAHRPAPGLSRTRRGR